jgi:hypothetical protein
MRHNTTAVTSHSRWPATPVRVLWAVALLFAWLPDARAQQNDEQQGVEQGNYNIKQSVEFGVRLVSITGDQNAYDTFVNLQQGPRLLGFTTEMRSLDHHGTLFDRLYFSNFGYGGDPNDVSRLRISKNKWYDFDALFRRDENFWDYSLQANPLNPVAPAFANAPAGFTPVITLSPHRFDTRRRLGDYSLLLLPQSRVRFRLGYARNINEGPTFTTIHQGTEQLLFQDWKTTVNTYRVGVDVRLLPKTSISFDLLWNDYKGDTGSTDQNQLFALSNGTPVDIGISLNAGANQPCANTFGGPPAGAVNPTCSAYFSYLTHARARTNTLTEQVSLQSNYWKNVDISARFSYTGGDANVADYIENLFGREARANLRNALTTGSVPGRRVMATSDFGVTWHITDEWSFLDSFHFSNFHNPMEFDSSACSFFSANLLTPARVFTPGSPTPITCAAPIDGVPASGVGPITHSTSSGPDISIGLNGNFLKQDEKTNLAEIDYQFSPKLGARAGFRYRHRAIDDNFFTAVKEVFFPSNANRGDCGLVGGVLPTGCTANGDGSFTFATPNPTDNPGETLINEYAGVFGVWAQPTTSWRISIDTELTSADKTFTRISPRQSQEYRVRTKYKPASSIIVDGSIRIWEGRDNIAEVNSLQHDRAYGISVSFQPNEKLGFELGYDYNDVFSQILICYVSSTAPPGLQQCPGVTGLVQQLSTYTNKSHYGNFDALWMPFHRLTTHLGANLTETTGSAILLDPNAVPGPLNSKYLRPYGGLEYRVAKNWTGKAYWGYYGYHEDLTALTQDVFAPRSFRGNTVTLSVRYAF